MAAQECFVKRFMQEIANYVLYASKIIKDEQVNGVIEMLLESLKCDNKILVVGAGSQDSRGAFAMRSCIWASTSTACETITPPWVSTT
jgi:phosphoheptose isomerase